MCVPYLSALGTGVKAVSSVLGQVSSISQNISESNYRTQVAINNAESAKNEALRQRQLGIEEARQEKISGLQEANKLAARNAASGLDISGQTSSLGYDDVLNNAGSNAKSIQDSYNLKSESYMEQANSYLESAKINKKNTKNYLLNYALTGLGDAGMAASSWYDKNEGGIFPL